MAVGTEKKTRQVKRERARSQLRWLGAEQKNT